MLSSNTQNLNPARRRPSTFFPVFTHTGALYTAAASNFKERKMKFEITKNITTAKLYAGAGPLPARAKLVGTIKRPSGATGALVKLINGNYIQFNAGVTRTLPQDTNLKQQIFNTCEF